MRECQAFEIVVLCKFVRNWSAGTRCNQIHIIWLCSASYENWFNSSPTTGGIKRVVISVCIAVSINLIIIIILWLSVAQLTESIQISMPTISSNQCKRMEEGALALLPKLSNSAELSKLFRFIGKAANMDVISRCLEYAARRKSVVTEITKYRIQQWKAASLFKMLKPSLHSSREN
uniref:Uncharacterized protein n=1 Tax=Glossina austeni TaxID=7395 RepID=A0A1A9UWH4_GLOAU